MKYIKTFEYFTDYDFDNLKYKEGDFVLIKQDNKKIYSAIGIEIPNTRYGFIIDVRNDQYCYVTLLDYGGKLYFTRSHVKRLLKQAEIDELLKNPKFKEEYDNYLLKKDADKYNL